MAAALRMRVIDRRFTCRHLLTEGDANGRLYSTRTVCLEIGAYFRRASGPQRTVCFKPADREGSDPLAGGVERFGLLFERLRAQIVPTFRLA
jgi:hypothetical protein